MSDRILIQNKKTGSKYSARKADADAKVASGEWETAGPQRVRFKPELDDVVLSPEEYAKSLQEKSNPQQLAQEEIKGNYLKAAAEQEYGDENLAAFGVALGSGLTGGGTDWFNEAVGSFEPGEAGKLADANPFLNAAGQGTGAIVGTVASGGVGALGAVGRAATLPIGLAVKAGNAAKGALGGRLAGATVGAAIEGGLLGANQAVTQAFIHDEPLTAEAVFTGAGLGSIVAGTFGAGGYGLSKFAQRTGSKGLSQEAAKAFPESTSGFKPTYLDDPMEKVIRQAKSAKAFVSDPEAMATVGNATKAFDNQVDDMVSRVKASITPETDPATIKLLNEIEQVRGASFKQWQGFSPKGIQSALSGSADDAQKAIGSLDTYFSKADELAAITGDDLTQTKGLIDDSWARFSGREGRTGSPAEALNQVNEFAGVQAVDTPAMSPVGEDALAVALTQAVSKANKGNPQGLFSKLTQAAGKAAGVTPQQAAFNAAAGLAGSSALLGTYGGIISKISRAVLNLAKSQAGNVAKVANTTRPGAAASLANLGLAKARKDSLEEQYKAQTEALNNKMANMQATSNDIYNSTSGIRQASLGVGDKVQQQAMSVMAYLKSKQPLDPGTMSSMFRSRWKPSKAQMEQFARYAEGATNPMGVIERTFAKQGSVSPQEMEAVRTLYPAIFAETQKQILQNLPAIQENISYSQELRLGLLYDMPINSLSSPESVKFFDDFWTERSAAEQPPPPSGKPMAPETPTTAQRLTER